MTQQPAFSDTEILQAVNKNTLALEVDKDRAVNITTVNRHQCHPLIIYEFFYLTKEGNSFVMVVGVRPQVESIFLAPTFLN